VLGEIAFAPGYARIIFRLINYSFHYSMFVKRREKNVPMPNLSDFSPFLIITKNKIRLEFCNMRTPVRAGREPGEYFYLCLSPQGFNSALSSRCVPLGRGKTYSPS